MLCNGIWFDYRAYCLPHHYSSTCDVYCMAQDSAAGHYTCLANNGTEKCLTGWMGENCDEDITMSQCEHGVAMVMLCAATISMVAIVAIVLCILLVRTVMKLFPSAIVGLASTMAHAVEILKITLVLALTNGLDLTVDWRWTFAIEMLE